jgi:hypothetical protein
VTRLDKSRTALEMAGDDFVANVEQFSVRADLDVLEGSGGESAQNR